MTSRLAVLPLALVLLGFAASPALAAKPRVVSAYAYLHTFKKHKVIEVRYRTDKRLKDSGGYGYNVVSKRLRCYAEQFDRAGRGVGDRLRFRGHNLQVLSEQPGYEYGAPLGCGADPKSKVAFYTMFYGRELEPRRMHFTANSGPYFDDIGWNGWGTNRAVGRGAYILDCASCGEDTTEPGKIIFRKMVRCPRSGGMVYRHGTLITRNDRNRKRRRSISTGYDGCFYD